MNFEYKIETLANTFLEHARKSDEQNKKVLEHFKENFPDSEVPEYISNPFDLPRALSIMADEIVKLKNICT